MIIKGFPWQLENPVSNEFDEGDKGLNSSERSFRVVWPLLFSQTIGAFNDNAMKAMIPLIAAVQLGKGSMDEVSTRVSVLLIVPFVIFAP